MFMEVTVKATGKKYVRRKLERYLYEVNKKRKNNIINSKWREKSNVPESARYSQSLCFMSLRQLYSHVLD